MGQTTIRVAAYIGPMGPDQFESGSYDIGFHEFGGFHDGVLEDDDGSVSEQDSGVSTFDGQPLTFLGSGLVWAGVDNGGSTDPSGEPVPILIFEAGGQIYFDTPAGMPDLTNASAVVIDMDADATATQPVCFAEGTQILTEEGERPIEQIMPGDRVIDWFGQSHCVIWAGARHMRLVDSRSFASWHPVSIARDALGPGRPLRDTLVSQQHRIYLDQPFISMIAGVTAGLAAASRLVDGQRIRIDRTCHEVRYCHLLCDEHVILVANGLPAESLLLTPHSAELMAEQAAERGLAAAPAHHRKGEGPGLQELLNRREAGMTLAAPELLRFEARLVSDAVRSAATRIPVRA